MGTSSLLARPFRFSRLLIPKLKDVKAVDAIPDSVASRLQQNLEANRLRVEDMSQQFGTINKKFNDAGIWYAAVKGFSLVPEYCPYAPLRHQGDFDYLVEDKSLPAARRLLLEAGSSRKNLVPALRRFLSFLEQNRLAVQSSLATSTPCSRVTYRYVGQRNASSAANSLSVLPRPRNHQALGRLDVPCPVRSGHISRAGAPRVQSSLHFLDTDVESL